MQSIAILGEFKPASKTHAATNAAIEHSRAALGVAVEGVWVPTDEIGPDLFSRFSAVWVAPGSPYRDMEKALWAIREARERGLPCFGTCGGFQHMVVEYARNVLGFKEAHHAEIDPYASVLFITRLACSLAGREMQLTFREGSRVAQIYGALSAVEEYYCNFGVNPDMVGLLSDGRLRISGSDAEGEVRVIELPDHPFFMGTLFVPQMRSTPARPHPLVSAFLRSVADVAGAIGETGRAADANDDLREGALYARPHDEGTYTVLKILKLDEAGIHVRMYSNVFPTLPKAVDESELYMASLDRKPDEALGMGHLPISRESFPTWGAVFIQASTIAEEELEGYRIWLEAGGGYF